MKITNLMMTALAFAAVMTVSCEKSDPTSGEQHTPVPYDEVEMFVHRVLKLDENGVITGTMGGLQLDESDPGKITIVAEDYSAAEHYFEGLFPNGADTYQNSNGDLIWNLKDTLGVSQGYAVLKQVTGTTADGRIAEIELPASVRPLTSIVFVPQSSIPLNDSYWDISTCDALDYYYLGATVTVRKGSLPGGTGMSGNVFMRGQGDFVVIREYDPGKQMGVLLRLEPGEQNYFTESSDDSSRHRRRASYLWTLQTVHSILDANPALLTNFSAMGCPDWDHFYMCRKNNSETNDYAYNLKSEELEKLLWYYRWYYYEAWVYLFTVSPSTYPDDEYDFFVNLEWE